METCAICKKTFALLTPSHLKKHGLVGWEYARQYGDTAQCKDFLGNVYGELTVIDFAKTEKGRGYWLCKCVCGEEVEVEGRYLQKGKKTNCGCKNIRSTPSPRAAFQKVYREYTRSAQNKNRAFALDAVTTYILMQSPCFYCAIMHSNKRNPTIGNNNKLKNKGLRVKNRDEAWWADVRKRTYKFNGIDRLDNSKGYLITNAVPCCNKCNFVKSNDDFYEFVYWVDCLVANKLRYPPPSRNDSKRQWAQQVANHLSKLFRAMAALSPEQAKALELFTEKQLIQYEKTRDKVVKILSLGEMGMDPKFVEQLAPN